MNWNEFAKEVHDNSVAHGWWEDERSIAEIAALCHSELSEALEEYRAGRGMVWYKCDGHVCDELQCDGCDVRNERSDKPEGIAVELADCIIRILDWFGKNSLDALALIDEGARGYMLFQSAEYKTFGEFIGHMHWGLSSSVEANFTYYKNPEKWMGGVIAEIMEWAENNYVDMEEILRIKHEYNKSRPYRHGGKKL